MEVNTFNAYRASDHYVSSWTAPEVWVRHASPTEGRFEGQLEEALHYARIGKWAHSRWCLIAAKEIKDMLESDLEAPT